MCSVSACLPAYCLCFYKPAVASPPPNPALLNLLHRPHLR